MKPKSTGQLSYAAWMPETPKRLMTEFLDFIVMMVEANKPFMPLLSTELGIAEEVYLLAPEVGGSSALLLCYLQDTPQVKKIILLSDDLSPAREQRLQALPKGIKQPYELMKLSEVSDRNANTPARAVFSINQSHLLSDQELTALL